jgi:hypothetical protein
MQYRLRALTAAVLMCCLCGCAAVVAGSLAAGGTYSYVTGWLKRDYPVGLDKAYKATTKAAKDISLKVEKSEKTLTTASVDGKDGDRPFWINITDKGQGFVIIEVKVSYLGDELASRRIHEAIAKHL